MHLPTNSSLRSNRALSETAVGMICMALAMFLLPVGDTFAKLLTTVLHPVEVTLWRVVAQGLCLVPVAFFIRPRLHGAMFSPIIALSGALVAMTLTSLIWAFSVMPLATAIAVFFIEPLILTVLAGLLLKERVGATRLAAVGAGLIGALIVIRPGAGFSIVALLPLMAAFTYALNMIVLRYASQTRSGLTVQCGATTYAAFFLVVCAVLLDMTSDYQFGISGLPAWGWATLFGAGVFAAGSFILIAEAFRRSEAGVLASFQYLEIIGATAAGYWVFGELPDAMTGIGVTIILASGLVMFWREQLPSNRARLTDGRLRIRRIRAR